MSASTLPVGRSIACWSKTRRRRGTTDLMSSCGSPKMSGRRYLQIRGTARFTRESPQLRTTGPDRGGRVPTKLTQQLELAVVELRDRCEIAHNCGFQSVFHQRDSDASHCPSSRRSPRQLWLKAGGRRRVARHHRKRDIWSAGTERRGEDQHAERD